MTKPAPTKPATKSGSATPASEKAPAKPENPHATRETVESIVIAVILAFLFRTFVAEAFVIPTGSMAPTLEGSHKDVVCDQCGFPYQAGASCENEESGRNEYVVAGTCPVCRYTMVMDFDNRAEHRSFTGDRILVSKFAYDTEDPKRWDIIVFKYPNNAKQNYIKRLVGLPGETLRIKHGDLYVRQKDSDFEIARKPPHKIKAMLQTVDDSDYLADKLKQVKWPSRWQPWNPEGSRVTEVRTCDEDVGGFTLESTANEESWLRYRHLVPSASDWLTLDEEGADATFAYSRKGELITDFYAYNAQASVSKHDVTADGIRLPDDPMSLAPDMKALGLHWVGDLALEADVDIQSTSGELLLDLVEGGVHFQCRIDIATGKATLSTSDNEVKFGSKEKPATGTPTANTAIRGGKKYHLRFSNLDDELRLWVDESIADFIQPTTYVRPKAAKPVFSPKDPGDLGPVGIATRGAKVKFSRLHVLRDVYYIAVNSRIGNRFDAPGESDYDNSQDSPVSAGLRFNQIREALTDPQVWSTTDIFDSRREVIFELQDDQFFPLGDNSPQSKDGRLWGEPAYVERDLLTGKAIFVYWPHPLPKPVPFTPNIFRMRLIK